MTSSLCVHFVRKIHKVLPVSAVATPRHLLSERRTSEPCLETLTVALLVNKFLAFYGT
jgi:hypothetical protein